MTVEEALRVLAEAWGPGYELRPPAAAHVEFVGGGVESFRVYAADGTREVLVGHVPRTALNTEPEDQP
jgi:hypothetical protein